MDILTEKSSMRRAADRWRAEGRRIALVPTMGYFHEGHLSLMDMARKAADRVVVSLFVNPAQFGPSEDLARYPRDLERDAALAEARGVDCLFAPPAEEMYPAGYQTWVEVTDLAAGLCGASRPGHFRGVCTVVAKLFNIVRPDVAVFGAKDFQQLQVVRRMAADLDLPVEILAHPVVREPDGLAMSSRNTYLSPEERRSALSLFSSLELAARLVREGEREAGRIEAAVAAHIRSAPGTRIDYVFVGDPETLRPVKRLAGPTLLALAVWVGKTRLIDNTILEPCPTGPMRAD
ncbi:pantoate--beta-alanine ligase [Dissulfurirhabdus thermomarina]|uniref:Pantothenate synthetase n=1 Tax=Dissulfurirhabdus thermomarina TaxID=1765737 RepID=A0A6N9TRD4_DISTH|nr:pantoate--beta-alanine ligase [Dissulfurirhabdus thermomarina]NDY42314.1 pantoate--beta-alanine ligase [Dissulfurirhabdus thermomarina]NMX22421.1 pantoate--beta-alanine ligase [Dissulfurirhabdus thermomarina]